MVIYSCPILPKGGTRTQDCKFSPTIHASGESEEQCLFAVPSSSRCSSPSWQPPWWRPPQREVATSCSAQCRRRSSSRPARTPPSIGRPPTTRRRRLPATSMSRSWVSPFSTESSNLARAPVGRFQRLLSTRTRGSPST